MGWTILTILQILPLILVQTVRELGRDIAKVSRLQKNSVFHCNLLGESLHYL